MKRLDFDHYFMVIANEVSKRSTCARENRQVGAVLTQNNRIIATGYNGSVSGAKHCIDIGCAREGIPSGEHVEKCRAVHAEMNTLCQCAKYGIPTEDSVMYVTLQPCSTCVKLMLQSGVKRVVYRDSYPGSSEEIEGIIITEL